MHSHIVPPHLPIEQPDMFIKTPLPKRIHLPQKKIPKRILEYPASHAAAATIEANNSNFIDGFIGIQVGIQSLPGRGDTPVLIDAIPSQPISMMVAPAAAYLQRGSGTAAIHDHHIVDQRLQALQCIADNMRFVFVMMTTENVHAAKENNNSASGDGLYLVWKLKLKP